MTLIDHFNAFQGLSKGFALTANARSLYFAILAEFNAAQYPAELRLHNQLLQYLSGISASSSFDLARNALINAGAITHKKNVYTLGKAQENLCKDDGKPLEKSWKNDGKSLGLVSNTLPKEKEKEKKRKETTATTATAGAREGFLKETSPKIAEAWLLYEGEKLTGGQMIDLYGLEKLYGVEEVVDAIIAASRSNKLPRLTYNFLKTVLERRQKGGAQSDSGGKYDRIDICPD